MSRLSRPILARLTVLVLLGPALACAPLGAQSQPDSAAVEEIRQASQHYAAALRRADVAALEQFWAVEYAFVNPRGELVTKAERLANLRTGRTTFDTLTPQVREERIRVYDDVAVHANLLTIAGRYSGQAHGGTYRALVVWVRRDERWQQVASQLTAVTDTAAAPAAPGALSPAAIAGTWRGRSFAGEGDSVVATWEFTATSETTGWTVTLTSAPKPQPIPVRVVAVGGDSIITDCLVLLASV